MLWGVIFYSFLGQVLYYTIFFWGKIHFGILSTSFPHLLGLLIVVIPQVSSLKLLCIREGNVMGVFPCIMAKNLNVVIYKKIAQQ
jgi:hypothetical protein